MKGCWLKSQSSWEKSGWRMWIRNSLRHKATELWFKQALWEVRTFRVVLASSQGCSRLELRKESCQGDSPQLQMCVIHLSFSFSVTSQETARRSRGQRSQHLFVMYSWCMTKPNQIRWTHITLSINTNQSAVCVRLCLISNAIAPNTQQRPTTFSLYKGCSWVCNISKLFKNGGH